MKIAGTVGVWDIFNCSEFEYRALPRNYNGLVSINVLKGWQYEDVNRHSYN
jgi:hypothetical protein